MPGSGHRQHLQTNITKGVNAGLLMAKTTSLLHCLAKHVPDPARLLAMINNEICENSVRGYFVTMIVGIYNLQTRGVRLVNAGHLPALVFGRDQTVCTLDGGYPPLGIVPDYELPYRNLSSWRVVHSILYSDGITEAKTSMGGMLGQAGLIALLQHYRRKLPMQCVRSAMLFVRNNSYMTILPC